MAESLTLGYLKRRDEAREEAYNLWMRTPSTAEPADTSPEASRLRYMQMVEDMAPVYGVDPLLAMAVIEQESRWNPKAVSPAGAQGLMQLMPATGRRFGVTDPFDPQQNLRGGLRYLSYLQTLFPGDREKQLAAYNAGEGAVQKYGGVPPYPETQDYVARVQSTTQGGQPYVGKEEQKALRGAAGEALTTLPARGERLESPAGAQARAMETQLGGQPIPSPGVQEGTTVQVRPGAIGPARQTMQPVSEEEARIFEESYTPPTAVTVAPGRLAEQAQPLSPVLGPGLEPGLEEPVEQRVPVRMAQGAVRAVANVLGALPAFEAFVGIQTPFGNTAQDAAQALEQAATAMDPTGTETGLVDRMAETAGGQIVFFGAGVAGNQALQFITAAAPRIVRAVGLTPAAISAVTEAGAEASQTYEALRPLVGDKQAAQRANTVFWRNVWLLTVTNKVGIFGNAEKPLARVLAGGTMEGVQEVLQYDVQRRAFWVPATHPKAKELEALGWERQGDRVLQPFVVKDAAEAGLLGALMGGGMAGVAGEIGTEREAVPEERPAEPERLQQTQAREGYGTETPGAPVRVYHGTRTDQPLTLEAADPDALYGPGLYFTDDPTVAGGEQTAQGFGDLGYASTAEKETAQLLRREHAELTRDLAALEGPTGPEVVRLYLGIPEAQVTPADVQETQTRLTTQIAELERRPDWGQMQGQPNVRPAYVNIQQPFDVEELARPEVLQAMIQAGIITGTALPETGYSNADVYDILLGEFGGDKAQVNAWLQQQGYDGITHLGGIHGGTQHRVWIAFDPSQVIPAYSAEARPDLPPWQATLTGLYGTARDILSSESGGIRLPQFPQQPSPPRPVTLAEGAAGLEPSRFRDAQGRWRIPLKDMPAEELELQDFIRQQGGIRLTNEELQGELKALISSRETGTTGLQNNVSGRSLQAMAERAQEFGFIATADKTALLEALDRSVRQGIAHYSQAASGYVPLVEDPTTRMLYEELVELSNTYAARVETQRRGTQPHAVTHAEGAAKLASGEWTIDDILEIPPGAVLDAAFISATVQGVYRMGGLIQQKAREYLASGAEIGSPEEKSFLQDMGIMAQVEPILQGLMAESGRALGILNDPLSAFNRFIRQFQPHLASMHEQASVQLARRIAALETQEQAAKTVLQLTTPGFGDMLLEVWINGLLSSPRTQMVNFVSNAMTAGWAIPERLTAGLLPGGEISPGESMAQLWGLMQGIREGWQMAWQVVRTGERDPSLGVGTTKAETRYPKAVTAQNVLPEGWADSAFGHAFDFWAEYIGLGSGGRLPTRGLLATDEFFRAVNYRMELAALAYRQGRSHGLTPEARKQLMVDVVTRPDAAAMRQAAQEFAIVQTFQRELDPQSWGGRMQTLAGATATLPGLGALPVGRALLPFIRTPTNIARWATERTPFGLFYQEMWADVQAGGARKELALAKVTLGTVTMAGIAGLALAGFLTGRGPEDKHLRAALERTGWQPYSVKINGTYFSYDRFDPLGLMIGMTTDVVQMIGDQSLDTTTKLIAAPFFALMRGLTNKTYLSGLARFFDAVSPQAFSEPEEWGEGVIRWIRAQAGSVVPSSVATLTQALDPWDRELSGWFDGALERTPWTVDGLPLKRDRWGMPKLLGWGFDDTWLTRLGRAVTPLTISQDLVSPIDAELLKQNIRLGMPSKSFLPKTDLIQEWLGDPLTAPQLTPAQYEQYVLYSAANVDELERIGLDYPADRLRILTTNIGAGVWATPPEPAMPLLDVLDWAITTKHYLAQSEGPGGGRERIIRGIAVEYQEAARDLMLARHDELRVRYEAAVKLRGMQQTPPAQRQGAEQRYDRQRQRGLGIGR